jgi:hypothetical protein
MAVELEPKIVAERAAAQAKVDRANAEFERLKVAYAAGPDARAARARAELSALENDPSHVGRALTDRAAQQHLAALRTEIANAEAESDRLSAFDRLDAAFHGDPKDDPLVETTTTEAPLTTRDMRKQIADDKAAGIDPAITQERFLPNRNPPSVIAEARRRLEACANDPEWGARLSRNDPATVEEFLKLSLVARSTEDEPPWSLSL